jgi:hypothetical protein
MGRRLKHLELTKEESDTLQAPCVQTSYFSPLKDRDRSVAKIRPARAVVSFTVLGRFRTGFIGWSKYKYLDEKRRSSLNDPNLQWGGILRCQKEMRTCAFVCPLNQSRGIGSLNRATKRRSGGLRSPMRAWASTPRKSFGRKPSSRHAPAASSTAL